MTLGNYWPEQEVFDALEISVSSGTPSEEFLAYLKNFQQDKLTTGTPNRPPNFYMQSVGVMTIMSKQLQNQGRHQVIKQVDVPSVSPTPNFLSVIAAMSYVTHEIELTNNIGYDPVVTEAGIHTATAAKIGYAEIVVGDDLVQKLTKPVTQTRSGRMPTATIGLVDDRTIYAMLDDGREFRISRRLTIGAQPHSFIQHMRANPLTSLGKGDIEIATGSRDITDLVHRCGFDEKIKPLFFPNTNEQTVYFRPSVDNLTPVQVEALEKHRWE